MTEAEEEAVTEAEAALMVASGVAQFLILEKNPSPPVLIRRYHDQSQCESPLPVFPSLFLSGERRSALQPVR